MRSTAFPTPTPPPLLNCRTATGPHRKAKGLRIRVERSAELPAAVGLHLPDSERQSDRHMIDEPDRGAPVPARETRTTPSRTRSSMAESW